MSDDPLIGRQLGNFRLERILGRGGMAQVYYGWDVKLERPVAVKVVDSRFRNEPSYTQRFVREAQSVAKWRHNNIGQIYHADDQDGISYFAMEYVDGMDLGQLLSQYTGQNELMPQADVIRIGHAVAGALDYAHGMNVVHRDVKPSNVMIARDDRIVLTDFGLALDVQQGSMGEVFGTAHYIAPEQAKRSADAVPQSDLYSLGIMLYEMLTGIVPFDDPSPTAVALQHITQPPPAPSAINPNLNSDVEAVLLKVLGKSPQDRYQSGSELMIALEKALQVDNEADAPVPLPPLPAGMGNASQPMRLSQMTVVEAIASQSPINVSSMKASAAPQIGEPASREMESKPSRPQRQWTTWTILGGCAAVSVIGIIVVGFIFANPLRNMFQSAIQSDDISPTSVPDVAAAVETESANPQPTANFTEAETTVAEPQSATALPTVKYPDGKRFMLFYDNNSLYFLNLSESTIPINWVAFERMSDADIPLNRFEGNLWARYYSESKPGWCTALEILDSGPYLKPPECGHENLFLSLRTPVRSDEGIFWTSQQDSNQFRVLWREGGNDEEVARCEIGAGMCEVFLP